MLTVAEKYIDKITEAIYLILKGDIPPLIVLPDDFPDNEISQMTGYLNQFITEYAKFSEFMYSIARGELDYQPPKGKMKVVQSFKSLQSNLRHLTWKTQEIAKGDFSQKVDFMGDFSKAFNQMTQQLKDTFLEIEQKNKDITASIAYAKRIQEALLPQKERIQSALPESFILFKPRDIVSGDFYWFDQKDEKIFIAAADCTGHGVPGAFMSMLGISFLNEILNGKVLYQPDKMLNALNSNIFRALKQEKTHNKDGMDIALCMIDNQQKRVEFAGANNFLIVIQDDNLHEIKGDRLSIGGRRRRLKENLFTLHSHSYDISQKTRCYMSSDGYSDQFGGDSSKKFTRKRLKQLFRTIHKEPMKNQEEILEQNLKAWMKDEKQVDDILVVGFEIG
ncbi:SpoIIE family protein phosphatase [Desulfobacterales bacterium HSG16]|nr:SpoIIE family protein phosphatase [Desulfobacterales bacterium HSG16]